MLGMPGGSAAGYPVYVAAAGTRTADIDHSA